MKNRFFAACVAVLGLVAVVACFVALVHFLGGSGAVIGSALLVGWVRPDSSK